MNRLRQMMIRHRVMFLFWSITGFVTGAQLQVLADEVLLRPQFIGQPDGGRTTDLKRSIADEVVYDVIVDRFSNGDRKNDSGGIAGGPSRDGYYPQHMEFFHGGDLIGLTTKLDYLEALGVTAIRLSPIMSVNPVQGEPGQETGGYHGRWVVDFTRPDSRYGSPDDLKKLITSAHRKGIRVYLTAIVNGTADLIRYRQCHDPEYPLTSAGADCAYRSIARYPYVTVGGLTGAPINQNFEGIGPTHRTIENFARLNDPNFALTPYLADTGATATAMTPNWMNDLRMFNNRGNAADSQESRINGDIKGQDDLMVAHPRVRNGLIDIYKNWIEQYRIDGLHIADVDAVDEPFLQSFTSAIQAHALSLGIENFVVSASPELDQAGPQAAYRQHSGIGAITDTALSELVFSVMNGDTDVSAFRNFFAQDNLYSATQYYPAGTASLPVAFSDAAKGRLAGRLRATLTTDENRLLQDLQLAYAVAFFLRGVPVIYYGDEQGFVSDSNGPSAQEDMLASKVESYIDNDLLGTSQTPGVENFDRMHPLYRAISAMAAIRAQHQTLRTGTQDVLLARDGVLIVSRTGLNGDTYLIAFNFANDNKTVQLAVDPRLTRFSQLVGQCQPQPNVQGSYRMSIPDHQVAICIGTQR